MRKKEIPRVSRPAPEQLIRRGQAFIRGGQSLKLSTKAAVFKKVSLLIGGSQACQLGGQGPPGEYKENLIFGTKCLI